MVWGLWAGEQAGTARGWSVWTGGSGILCVCCFSFLTKRLVLASVCLIPWDLVEDIRLGLERAMEVKFLQACSLGRCRGARCVRHSWIGGIKAGGLEIRTRDGPSRLPCSLTGEGREER